MNGDLNLNYALGENIDATATSGWNLNFGFVPVSSSSSQSFNGTFDGLAACLT